MLVAGIVSAFAAANVSADHGAFNYDPIAKRILSATISIDFAALMARRRSVVRTTLVNHIESHFRKHDTADQESSKRYQTSSQ